MPVKLHFVTRHGEPERFSHLILEGFDLLVHKFHNLPAAQAYEVVVVVVVIFGGLKAGLPVATEVTRFRES